MNTLTMRQALPDEMRESIEVGLDTGPAGPSSEADIEALEGRTKAQQRAIRN